MAAEPLGWSDTPPAEEKAIARHVEVKQSLMALKQWWAPTVALSPTVHSLLPEKMATMGKEEEAERLEKKGDWAGEHCPGRK